MNALLIITLVVAALLAIGFFIAISKSSAGWCLALFVAAIAVICAVVILTTLPPKTETYTVVFSNQNSITLYDGRGNNFTIDITKIPRVNASYGKGTTVQLTRDGLGTPIFLSPTDCTLLPSQKR
jgi:hypothetical protein